ncbi:MAG: ATP-binding protein [Nocardioidaceae bacterium]
MSPVNRPALPLDPEPRSVREARTWVTQTLRDLDREDLIAAAQLGVSELVTNAILHATPPILVRVRGTSRHPRIEVHDHSHQAPAVGADMTEDERLLSTVGRGLEIVALHARSWGAEVSSEGKIVWFEPTDDEHIGVDAEAPFNLHILGDAETPEEPSEQLTVQLLGMPVQVFARFRVWFLELRRELRLLALAHGEDYPVAVELSELTQQSEREQRNAFGLETLDQAIAEGAERVDLTYRIPQTAPSTMGRLLEVLERADQFCREQRLLALAGSPQQLALQRWYLGEFVRQGQGEPPRPWPGEYTIEDTSATP